MPAHRSIRDFDWLMLILVCAICALGVLQIFSATRDTRFAEAWWKQAVWILAGFKLSIAEHSISIRIVGVQLDSLVSLGRGAGEVVQRVQHEC